MPGLSNKRIWILLALFSLMNAEPTPRWRAFMGAQSVANAAGRLSRMATGRQQHSLLA